MLDSTFSDLRGKAPAPRTGTLLRHKLAGAPRLWTSIALSILDVCCQVLAFHPQPSGILALSRHAALLRRQASEKRAQVLCCCSCGCDKLRQLRTFQMRATPVFVFGKPRCRTGRRIRITSCALNMFHVGNMRLVGLALVGAPSAVSSLGEGELSRSLIVFQGASREA